VPGALTIVLAVTAACIAGAVAIALLRDDEYESTATVRGAVSPELARSAKVARRALAIAGRTLAEARKRADAAAFEQPDAAPRHVEQPGRLAS
jgi:uncharacterized metal-binding protein